MHCRDNILLGEVYDVQRYQAVLYACALQHDVLHMSKGDLTTVGDRGSALSGGQRARLALARALYQVTCLQLAHTFSSYHPCPSENSQSRGTRLPLAQSTSSGTQTKA